MESHNATTGQSLLEYALIFILVAIVVLIILYLLGLLNSKFGYFYFRSVCAGLEGKNEIYLRFFGQYLESLDSTR